MTDVVTGIVGEVSYVDSTTPSQGIRLGKQGDVITSQLHGRYAEASMRGRLFMAQAIVTAPVIYTTAAGTGGPLLWNNTATHKASILAVGWGVTVVTTVAAALGITGNTGQTSAPGSTTAIDGSRNLLLGGPAPAMNVYRIGTPSSAGNFLMPVGDLHTGALTVDNTSMHWVDLGGIITVPQYGWCSLAASATASTTVGTFAMIWEEIPV